MWFAAQREADHMHKNRIGGQITEEELTERKWLKVTQRLGHNLGQSHINIPMGGKISSHRPHHALMPKTVKAPKMTALMTN